MADGVAVALRPVLCEDIGIKIQHIVHKNALKKRNLQFKEIHREFYGKAFNIITNKILVIQHMMLDGDVLPDTLEYNELDKTCYEWSYILDDIYENHI